MTRAAALRQFREALRRYKRAPVGEKRRSLDRLVRARTELMKAEIAGRRAT